MGLGNSTRCDSIIHQLITRGWKVSLVTAGNGLWYFRDRDYINHIYEIEELRYGSKDGQISINKTLGSVKTLASINKRNRGVISRALQEIQPNAVISDSVYIFGLPTSRNIPWIALNNTDMVYQAFNYYPSKPLSIWPQFYCIEMIDYLFHKLGPDVVISPCIDLSIPLTHKKFHRVEPIVRQGFEQRLKRKEKSRVVIMLSGSRFGSPVRLSNSEYPFQLDIIGRPAPTDWKVNEVIHYHGKVQDSLQLLRNADLAVVNGGFSAVSEVVCMGIPAVVVPVLRHAEQWVNAKSVDRLGIGTMAEESFIESAMLAAWDRLDDFNPSFDNLELQGRGAQQSADIIESVVS